MSPVPYTLNEIGLAELKTFLLENMRPAWAEDLTEKDFAEYLFLCEGQLYEGDWPYVLLTEWESKTGESIRHHIPAKGWQYGILTAKPAPWPHETEITNVNL